MRQKTIHRSVQGSIALAILLTIHCTLFAVRAAAQFQRRSVVEEFTGTWCGHCPRGAVGLQRLSEDLGDKVIVIAVHTGTGEPMLIPSYCDVQTDVIPGSGAPSCIIDRNPYRLDPYSGSGQRGHYHYGIDADVADALAVPTEARVELRAQWDDDYLWDVRYTVTTTFSIDSPTAPYRLMLVLTADSLTGTTDSWRQVNYFSAEYEETSYRDDDMAFWRAAPYYVSGVAYNHVAVNTLGIRTGIAGSIAAPIRAYEPQTYTNTVTTLATHAQKIIQDKSRLQAIAILINSETGLVVNAARADILPYGADGISDARRTDAAADGPACDLSGRRVSRATALQRGLYITGRKKYITKN